MDLRRGRSARTQGESQQEVAGLKVNGVGAFGVELGPFCGVFNATESRRFVSAFLIIIERLNGRPE
jgi:hypothetical protein